MPRGPTPPPRRAAKYQVNSHWNEESAQQWAVRKAFTEKELDDFDVFLVYLDRCFVKPQLVTGHTKIDEGAFGEIDKAYCKGKTVVVKTVLDGKGKRIAQVLRETLLELSIVSQLNHPNIVKFMGAAVHFPLAHESNQEMQLGLIYEYCEKSSVINYIKKNVVTFKQKVRMAMQIAEGMSYLHDLNVIHRDLNTRNCLLSGNMQVKICDFGFARQITRSGWYDSTTISGTAEYMPPEQLSGGLLVLKTDCWAMGTIMWEFATGRAPWGAVRGDIHGKLVEYVHKKGQRLPLPGKKDIPDQPAGVASAYTKLMMNCFVTEPSYRPSMRELRNRLRVLNARVNGGSSFGVSLGNMFSCGFGGRLNNDLKQFSTFSRNKDTTKPRISTAPASAQMNHYGSSQVAPPPRQQAQVMSQQPPVAQQQIQQVQQIQGPPPGMFGQPQTVMMGPPPPQQMMAAGPSPGGGLFF